MALTFGGATSDRVDFGNPGNITDSDIIAWLVWVRPTTLTNQRIMACKNSAGIADGPLMRLNGTGGNWEMRWNRTTTNGVAVTTNTPLSATGVWVCLCGIFDPSDSQPRCYSGTLTTSMVEATYAGGASIGAGTTTAAANLRAGNLSSGSPTVAFQGDIGPFLYMVGAKPSLGEMEQWRWHPQVLSGTKLFTRLGSNGTSTQPDWSGNGNAGTVTGATLTADDVPLGPWFGYGVFSPYIPATVTGWGPLLGGERQRLVVAA